MRLPLLVLLAAATLAAESPKTPVLVELFTSEGCSSCPPADRLAIELQTLQPIPGVEIIVLSEHVDYWNRLGWTDRFSSAAFTRRQNWYSVRWPTKLYTPQTVVDGLVECVGSDRPRLEQAIRKVGSFAKAPGRIAVKEAESGRVNVTAAFDGIRRSRESTIRLAVVEDALESWVLRGENSGLRLRHTAVVRSLESIAELKRGQKKAQVSWTAPIDPSWKAQNLRFVAFVQENKTRAVVGIAATSEIEGR